MESRVPLPTDNIYKFFALFGLLLLLFSIGATVVLQRGTNETVYKLYVELETLRAPSKEPNAAMDQKSPPSIREALLEKLIDVAAKDKKTLSTYLTWLSAFASVMAAFGFYKWYVDIQPLQDEMLKLQLKKLRHEVSELPTKVQG